MNTPEDLKEVFAKCKLFVTGDMRDYYTVMHAKGDRFKQIWDVLAMWCNSEQINGRAYVEWCFATEYPSYPQPSKFITKYKKDQFIAQNRPDPKLYQADLKFKLMLGRLEKKPEQQDVVVFLLDPLNDFDPLFIYTVAKNLKRQDELPPDILPRARQQVFCQPVYAEKFKDILPEELIAYGLKPVYN